MQPMSLECLAAKATVTFALADIEFDKNLSISVKPICSNTIWSVKVSGNISRQWENGININLPLNIKKMLVMTSYSFIASQLAQHSLPSQVQATFARALTDLLCCNPEVKMYCLLRSLTFQLQLNHVILIRRGDGVFISSYPRLSITASSVN